MLVIGLTGGIGSGKSAVGHYFAKLGIPIIDADKIARELVASKQPALEKITNYFGKDILTKRGSLNRRLLRRLIFKNPIDKKWLEKLLHPQIKRKIRKRLKRLHHPYAIVETPLLIETKFTDIVDRVLVIDAPEELQIKRIIARDGGSVAEIKAIIHSQLQREARLAKADDIIHNEGNLADLQQQVNLLHEQYLRLARRRS